MADYHSVLVIRLSSLGDVLFALPAVQRLAASGRAERVSWLVEDRAAGLLRSVEGLHEVVVFPRRSKRLWPAHLRRLRARRDELVIDLQGNLKSRVQLAFLRAPRKLGYDAPMAKEGAQKALTERFVPGPGDRHRVASHAAVMRHLGVDVPAAVPRPTIAVDETRRARVDGSLPAGRPRVALHAGTSAFGEFKRWSPERFGALGDRLAHGLGATVVLTGGPDETELVERMGRAMTAPAVAPPPDSLDELTALLASVDLLVAADSLPLHLANALGTPVVGLYGPKDPAVNGPYFDRSRVVRAGVACSPCTLRRCSDRICMERLTVDAVEAAARELLAESGATP